jgi:lipopolysaccharide/colanic/teichoic acid biosynthesis glycosyltransferase
MSFSVDRDTTVFRRDDTASIRIRPTLPAAWLGPAVFLVELFGVIALSIISNIAYHELLLDSGGDLQAAVAIGGATFFYYGIIFAYRGNYGLEAFRSASRQVRDVAAVWLIVISFLSGIAFLLKIGPNFSRGATLVFFTTGWAFLTLWRLYLARAMASAASSAAFEHRVVLLVSPNQMADHDQLQRLKALTREDATISEILLAVDWQEAELIERAVKELRTVPLAVKLLPDRHVARFLKPALVDAGPLAAAELQRGPLSVEERAVKRLIDVSLACLALVALAPLMLLVAVLIKVDSPGPVFFIQTRGGFNGRPFRILKFRTLQAWDDGPVVPQVQRGDARLTRLGWLLRRTSIDELPQLLNVILGQMSLVGPRPHAAAHDSHYEKLIAHYAFRHHVKPGLTGWAQVHGYRGETDLGLMKQRVEHDLWYVNNWSLWLDFTIIARTFVLLFWQSRAY